MRVCGHDAFGRKQCSARGRLFTDQIYCLTAGFEFSGYPGGSGKQQRNSTCDNQRQVKQLFCKRLHEFQLSRQLGLIYSGIHAFAGCSEVLGPVVDNIQTGYITESIADRLPAYKRNFNGIFSVVEYNNPASSNGLSLLAVMHEENKGEAKPYAGGGVGSFRNSVSRSITNLVNGDTGSSCINENNGCYFAFVSAATIPYTRKTGYGHNPQWTDYGPIVWPSQGYISSDGTMKVANGPRHPHAIIAGNYAYVFYQDFYYTNGLDGLYNRDVGDRRGGMKVISSPTPQCSARELVRLLRTGWV